MEEDHEKLEDTMRSEHEMSVASYIAEAELVTEVIELIMIWVALSVSHLLTSLLFLDL